MSIHPALITYGSTPKHKFDLVLFVGREPNDGTATSVRGLGGYDFRKSPRCAFWNGAYGLFAHQAPTLGSTAAFKRLCVDLDASPVIMSDALPITLLHAARSKAKRREAVTEDQAREHVDHVFSHEKVMSRVKAIILSGLAEPVFHKARHVYHSHAKSAGIPVFETSFLYPTNMARIRDELGKPGSEMLGRALESFSPGLTKSSRAG